MISVLIVEKLQRFIQQIYAAHVVLARRKLLGVIGKSLPSILRWGGKVKTQATPGW